MKAFIQKIIKDPRKSNNGIERRRNEKEIKENPSPVPSKYVVPPTAPTLEEVEKQWEEFHEAPILTYGEPIKFVSFAEQQAIAQMAKKAGEQKEKKRQKIEDAQDKQELEQQAQAIAEKSRRERFALDMQDLSFVKRQLDEAETDSKGDIEQMADLIEGLRTFVPHPALTNKTNPLDYAAPWRMAHTSYQFNIPLSRMSLYPTKQELDALEAKQLTISFPPKTVPKTSSAPLALHDELRMVFEKETVSKAEKERFDYVLQGQPSTAYGYKGNRGDLSRAEHEKLGRYLANIYTKICTSSNKREIVKELYTKGHRSSDILRVIHNILPKKHEKLSVKDEQKRLALAMLLSKIATELADYGLAAAGGRAKRATGCTRKNLKKMRDEVEKKEEKEPGFFRRLFNLGLSAQQESKNACIQSLLLHLKTIEQAEKSLFKLPSPKTLAYLREVVTKVANDTNKMYRELDKNGSKQTRFIFWKIMQELKEYDGILKNKKENFDTNENFLIEIQEASYGVKKAFEKSAANAAKKAKLETKPTPIFVYQGEGASAPPKERESKIADAASVLPSAPPTDIPTLDNSGSTKSEHRSAFGQPSLFGSSRRVETPLIQVESVHQQVCKI